MVQIAGGLTGLLKRFTVREARSVGAAAGGARAQRMRILSTASYFGVFCWSTYIDL